MMKSTLTEWHFGSAFRQPWTAHLAHPAESPDAKELWGITMSGIDRGGVYGR